MKGEISFEKGRFLGVVATVSSLEEVRKARRIADWIEVRLDLIRAEDPVQYYHKMVRGISKPLIVTNRARREGGKWKGTEQERIEMLIEASSEANVIDVELSTERKLMGKVKAVGKPLIISYHNFNSTPPKEKLKRIIRRAYACGADVAKVAVTPKKVDDVLLLLDILVEMRKPLIAISMGKLGEPTRIVAPLLGSPLTYGYVDEPKAPGQLHVSELQRALQIIR